MNHMKNQISALSDPFPSLDDLKKKKMVWCGRLMAKAFIFNPTSVINYTICISHVSWDIILFLYLNFYLLSCFHFKKVDKLSLIPCNSQRLTTEQKAEVSSDAYDKTYFCHGESPNSVT